MIWRYDDGSLIHYDIAMSAEILIRPAAPSDLTAIERIIDEAYSPYVGRIGRKPGPMLDDYAALVADGRVSVLERDGTVQALLVLIPEADGMLLDNVAVSPSAQGMGLGAKLMRFAEDAARAAGCRSIRLYTNVAMTENIAIYERAGYAETHRAEEKGLQRVYMRKVLG